MKIEFDPTKSLKNLIERGLSFETVNGFDWGSALYIEDDRKAYTEKRIVALGYLGLRLHVLCFTPIDGGVRVISFRKANLREIKNYEKAFN
jgi:uncharacterized DUF497 family protein